MKTLLTQLTDIFFHSVQTAFPDAVVTQNMIEITPSTQEKFGHYQCNSAMKLTAQLKKNPREIAQAIVAALGDNSMLSHCEIAGPGFINITLSSDFLAKRTQTMLNDAALGILRVKTQHKIIIDFSSPNTAKEMHVGHLRSTIIGDCLARLFEFLGYDVLRLNHVGDWGTAFGMLIAHMKENANDVLQGKTQTNLTHLMSWYRESKKRFDEDAAFKKRAQTEVVALQSGDPTSLHAWEIICSISRNAYQEIYDLLDVKITERGESFYNPLLSDVVSDLEKKHLVTVSDGAKCIFIEGFTNRDGDKLPLLIQKSDGGFNYSTTDMAAIRHRIQTEKAQRIIYVTDAGQTTHFQMIFRAAELAGYLDPNKVTVNHVPFGLVLGPDGKKFKTRSGETERLIDLLTAAMQGAKKILSEREAKIDPDQLEQTAHVLGINAIKYADLACHRTGDYMFSYERMLRFEGNTAAFLMYAYVRVNGIKRKVGVDIEALKTTTEIKLIHPSEIALGLHLNQFGDVLEQMAKDLLPHRLTEYLFNLAERFNAFFRDCRVEGDAEQNSRLLLCETVARVMSQGLHILGLKMVEKM
ncbi:MAG: arginine--tRNA ligase [Gammaproteobacteria bacterium]